MTKLFSFITNSNDLILSNLSTFLLQLNHLEKIFLIYFYKFQLEELLKYKKVFNSLK